MNKAVVIMHNSIFDSHKKCIFFCLSKCVAENIGNKQQSIHNMLIRRIIPIRKPRNIHNFTTKLRKIKN